MKNELLETRFNLSPRSPMYSRDFEKVEVYTDPETHEIVMHLFARVGDTWDKEVRVKLR